MNRQLELIAKVFILSTGISILIKVVGPMLPIAPTQTNAIIGISVVPLITALALGWRTRQSEQK